MEEKGDIRGRVVEFIASQSKPWIETASMSCAGHPQAKALVICRSCGKPLCRECLKENPGGEAVCGPCFARKAKEGAISKAVAALKLPVFWVSFCIAVSGALYFAGVGNPGTEELVKFDAGQEWHKRKAATAMLAQGARERRRAAALKLKGDDAGAKAWSLLAAESFAKAAELWKDVPAASFAPALAAAESLSFAGEDAKAVESIAPLKAPSEKGDLAAWHFVSGKIAAAAGDKELARSHFKKAIAIAKEARESFFESVMSALAGDRRESNMASKVRLVSGLAFSPEEILKESRKRLGEEDNEKDAEDVWAPARKPAKRESPKGGGFEIEFLDGKKAD